MTLFEIVAAPLISARDKHGLPHNHVDDHINRMSNAELLQFISEVLEERLLLLENKQRKFTFFWNTKSPLTNWWIEDFVWKDITFNCSEQYMMYRKALMFKDYRIADLIMNTKSPREQKDYGREVTGYIDEQWSEDRLDIVVEGLLCKFQQSASAKQYLIKTRGTYIAEASPYDLVWGIGMEASHPDVEDYGLWRGKNLLGIALMRVRNIIIYNTTGDINV
jgi:ribA/ribD-fused uncharacterized protein